MKRALPFLVAAAIASGCAHPARTIGTRQPGDPAWPRGDALQIAYVGEIRGPENLGIKKGFFRRVWDFVTGRDDVEGLYRPYGVAVDGAGRIAIADPGRRTVHLYDPARGRTRRIESAHGARLVYPIAVAFAGRTLLVADPDARAVHAFDEDGKDVPVPAALPKLERPVGLAVDEKRGRLLVVDTAEHVVHVLPLGGGGEARRIGGRGGERGRFNFPTHVAVDADGRIAVCDAMNFRVQVFDAELRPIAAFGQLGDGMGDLSKPKGIAVDRDGVVFVVEGYFDVIQAFDLRGRLLGVFGGSGIRPGRFWLAGGLALDGRGHMYVADTFNARVQVFDLFARAP
jgi:DNA-binding beta-propeller fold protein YncE